MSMFRKAERAQTKLRMSLIGPSGSGKTWSALAIASGLGQKIALIDTERGSASKYSDAFAFDVLELSTFAPEQYIAAIKDAGDAGYDVLCIDSLSHAWTGKDGILEFVDKAAKRSQSGSSFGAWREATPKHNALVDAILEAPLHVLVTMRAKTEYVQEKNEKTGKTEIRKIGLQPIQRDGLEYEFDVVCDMTLDNDLIVSKTRIPFLSGSVVSKPSAELGASLRAWLVDGVAPAAKPTTVVINGKTYQTAGITKDTLLKLWNVSAVYDKAHGKEAAKAVLSWATGKDSSVKLTEEEGAQFAAGMEEVIRPLVKQAA